ncbi:MAG: hypothetical protein ABEJ26_00190 [Halosimplex sp.]
MSLERRLGLGLCSLGVGQAVLAVSNYVAPGAHPLETWPTAFLAGASFGLGALLVSGRLPLDGTPTQRRVVRLVANACILAGLGVSIVGAVLLVEHSLA